MKRFSFFYVMLLGGLVLLGTSGCAGGNPNISSAEDNLENENYEQALADVQTAIDENPQNAQAYLVKGRVLQGQASAVSDPQRHAEIIGMMAEAYDQAVEISPDLRSDVQNQRFFAYQSEMNQGIEAFNQAEAEQDTAAYNRAATFFGGAAQVQPDSVSATLNQAYALVNAGRAQAATGPLQDAVDGGAGDAQTYLLLSQLYSSQQEFDQAVTVLEGGTEQFPDNRDLQNELSNAYVRAGQTEEAMGYYESAIEREPQNPDYRYNYGSMLLSAERYEEAVEQLEQASELAPENAAAHYNLGAAYVNQAVEVNDQISQMQEENPEAQQPEMEELASQRRSLFEQAIPPLEEARGLLDAESNIAEGDICQALFSAYVQTEQQQKAEGVSACAGMDDSQ